MPKVIVKRGSRAQINAAAAGSGLLSGEVYLITDESRIAIGLGPTTYQAHAKQGEGGGGAAFESVTVNVAPASSGHAFASVANSAATPSSAVVCQLCPNDDWDADDVCDLAVTGSSRAGFVDFVVSRQGPIVGNLKIAYALT